jgi:hypothetical protein
MRLEGYHSRATFPAGRATSTTGDSVDPIGTIDAKAAFGISAHRQFCHLGRGEPQGHFGLGMEKRGAARPRPDPTRSEPLDEVAPAHLNVRLQCRVICQVCFGRYCRKRCHCRKFKRGYRGDVVHPRLARGGCGQRSGRRAESVHPFSTIGAHGRRCNLIDLARALLMFGNLTMPTLPSPALFWAWLRYFLAPAISDDLRITMEFADLDPVWSKYSRGPYLFADLAVLRTGPVGAVFLERASGKAEKFGGISRLEKAPRPAGCRIDHHRGSVALAATAGIGEQVRATVAQ